MSHSKHKFPAYVRAKLRDSEWLEKLQLQKNKMFKSQKLALQRVADDQTAEKLKHKLHEILINEKRPKRITLAHLGAYVGYSSNQMIKLKKKYLDLHQALKNMNDDKFRRQLVWAAKELKNEGVILTAKQIQRKASLPFSPTTSSIVKQLLNDK